MLNLLGAVALLLWGLRMVKTGVERAFGTRLQRWIGAGTRNRFLACGIGLVATLALQSSTATALMTAAFAGSGYMSGAMAQGVMLGANLGTSLVARLLSSGMEMLAPMLITVGVATFTLTSTRAWRSAARAILGAGLMLLALHLLGQATEPMRHAPMLAALMAALGAVPVLALLVAAVLACAASSSLAVVLLVMALADGGSLAPPLSVALVLGANLGGAVPPVLATLKGTPAGRRVTLGNLLMRLAGGMLVLPLAGPLSTWLAPHVGDAGLFVVDAHILFNFALAIVGLPLLDPVAAVMLRLVPDAPAAPDGPRHLDPAGIDTPAIALANAARETLRIGDRVATMLEGNLEALRRDDARLCAAAATLDDEVDRLNEAVKLYLARLSRPTLSETDAARASEIADYAVNLEHIGDIIDRNLRQIVSKKIRHHLSFSTEGRAEIEAFYERTLANLRLAQSLFLARDPELARQLVELKVDVRRFEQSSAQSHYERLRDGRVESVSTSALHLDILRDLKRINAHIASVAYPILEQQGALRESRIIEHPG